MSDKQIEALAMAGAWALESEGARQRRRAQVRAVLEGRSLGWGACCSNCAENERRFIEAVKSSDARAEGEGTNG